MQDPPQDPIARFLANSRLIALHRPVRSDLRLYERLKADLGRLNPSSDDYQQACAELARMCGV